MGVELLGKEARFLIPMLRNSDKQLHEIVPWEWIDYEMFSRFPGGWQQREVERFGTSVVGTVRGRWFDSERNEIVSDDSVEFVVALAPDQLPLLFRLFDEVCDRFDQKCIYFTTGGDAALYYPSKKVPFDDEPGEHE